MLVSTFLFFLGCCGSIGMYKPISTHNIDDQLHAQVSYAGVTIISFQYWALTSIVLMLVYSYSVVLTGFLGGTIAVSFVRRIPMLMSVLGDASIPRRPRAGPIIPLPPQPPIITVATPEPVA